MKRLYVGCLVRVANNPTGWDKAVGREGRIVEMGVLTKNPGGRAVVGAKVQLGPDLWVRAPYWALEPICGPGLEPCEEDFKRDLDDLLERQGVPA